MKLVSWLNGGGAVIAVGVAMLASGALPLSSPPAAAPAARSDAAEAVSVQRDAMGRPALRDASGQLVPVGGHHERVVSASPVADALLVELLEPTRLVGVSHYTATRGLDAHRYAGIRPIEAVDRLEPLLALRPDLVLLHGLGRPRTLARLREAGLTVFDLGRPGGVAYLRRTARRLGVLLGIQERVTRWLRRFDQRLARIAEHVPRQQRPRALYVSVFGKQLTGAGAGTSYHDLLVHAGLRDVAAEAGHQGYPTYSAEELIELNPQLLVTGEGMGRTLCRRGGVARLSPCRDRDKLIELPDAMLGAAGPGLLRAAERLNAEVFGDALAPPPSARHGQGVSRAPQGAAARVPEPTAGPSQRAKTSKKTTPQTRHGK